MPNYFLNNFEKLRSCIWWFKVANKTLLNGLAKYSDARRLINFVNILLCNKLICLNYMISFLIANLLLCPFWNVFITCSGCSNEVCPREKKIAIKFGTGCVQGSNGNDIATSVTFALSSLKKEEQYVPYILFPRNCKTWKVLPISNFSSSSCITRSYYVRKCFNK